MTSKQPGHYVSSLKSLAPTRAIKNSTLIEFSPSWGTYGWCKDTIFSNRCCSSVDKSQWLVLLSYFLKLSLQCRCTERQTGWCHGSIMKAGVIMSLYWSSALFPAFKLHAGRTTPSPYLPGAMLTHWSLNYSGNHYQRARLWPGWLLDTGETSTCLVVSMRMLCESVHVSICVFVRT